MEIEIHGTVNSSKCKLRIEWKSERYEKELIETQSFRENKHV